jgi:hypothetical protein
MVIYKALVTSYNTQFLFFLVRSEQIDIIKITLDIFFNTFILHFDTLNLL